MADLTEQNIREIEVLVEARGVEMKELSYDLVDHICCMIEEKMENGKNYANALEESLASFGKKGIRQIQEETTFLLTKNILAMRKTMHITGITAALLLLLGSIFKVQHWPGAGLMYLLGGVSLCLLFMPLFLAVRIKEKPGKTSTISNIIGILGGIALCLGILFKLMHWPWANILMNTGNILLMLIFLPIYIYINIKKKQIKTSTVVPVVVAIAGFSLFFSLVRIRDSHNVRDAKLNIQYKLNDDIIKVKENNSLLISSFNQDSVEQSFLKAQELAKSIDELTSNLEAEIIIHRHPHLDKTGALKIISNNYGSLSDDASDLSAIRNSENGLAKLLSDVEKYQSLYTQLTGSKQLISSSSENLDYYLNSPSTNFPLGLVILDLSLMNLEIQQQQTSLIHYYKGKVS